MKVVLSLCARCNVCRLMLLASSMLLPGCSRSIAPVPVVSAVSGRARAAASVTGSSSPEQRAVAYVHSLPLYQKAEQACKAKRYAQAAALLQRLGAQVGLTAAEITFVQQQRALCLQDAGLPVPASLNASAAASPLTSTLSLAEADCGPRALLLLCNRLGVKTTLSFLRQKAGTTPAGTSLAGLATAAKAVGLKAEGVQVSREALQEIEAPAIGYVNGNHFVEVAALAGKGESATATIHDPNAAGEETITQERRLRLCSGYLLLIKR